VTRNFGTRSLPPMPNLRYPPQEELPKKPSFNGLILTIVVVVALFVIGFGGVYLATGLDTPSTRVMPQSEQPPQVSVVPKTRVKSE
jgi:hypothetical protein